MLLLRIRNNALLVLCTILHFSVDGVCAVVLAKYAVHEPDFRNIIYHFGVYNIIAFGGQWLAGLFLDKHRKFLMPSLVIVPVLLAGGFMSNAGIFFQAVIIALGNCIFHVSAGILILERYGGFSEPGMFVSSGAVGLGLGLHRITGAFAFEILCSVGTLLTVLYVMKIPVAALTDEENDDAGSLGKSTAYLLAGAFLLFLCVTLRGFGGNLRIPEYVMLMPCIFMLGKSTGGILCDAIGFRKTILIIFLMSFAALQLSGFPGIITLTFAFNMTMPLTLRLLHWYFPSYPGLTFGIAAGCLLPGAFFSEYFRIEPEVMTVIQFISLFIAGYIFQRFRRKEKFLSLPQFSQH